MSFTSIRVCFVRVVAKLSLEKPMRVFSTRGSKKFRLWLK